MILTTEHEYRSIAIEILLDCRECDLYSRYEIRPLETSDTREQLERQR
jgi:hypothetical protein